MNADNAVGRDGYLAVNRNRRLLYAFLSRMYEKEVTLDLLKELSSESTPVFRVGGSEGLDDEFKKGFEMLGRYLSLSGRDLNEVKLELAVDYANLFLGLRGKPPHPSESVYRSADHSLFQEPRDEVLYAYWNAGVDKVKDFTEPEDHIAIELQFMEYLCRKTVEALERDERDEAKKYLQIQKKFVDDHLAKWVPQFTKDIIENADVDFYKGVAYVTRAFIGSERGAIGDLIEGRGLSPDSVS